LSGGTTPMVFEAQAEGSAAAPQLTVVRPEPKAKAGG
jgi:hypothetical protein